MKDYALQIKVRNNLLLAAMRRAGCETAAELSRLSGVAETAIGQILNLKISAQTPNGEWRSSLVKISKALKCLPEDLVPEQHFTVPLERNVSEIEVSREEIANVIGGSDSPQIALEKYDAVSAIDDALDRLPARHAYIVRRQFGLDGKEPLSNVEIAKELGISHSRVHQIGLKSLEKMRHPARRPLLLEAFDTLVDEGR